MKLVRLALLTSLICATLAVAFLTPTAAAPTSSATSVEAKASACPGSITMGGKRFATWKYRVTCTGQRRAIRTLYSTYGRRGTPRGFKCASRSRFRKTGGCRSKSGPRRYFGYSR
jgi:hypothetical protein